MPGESKYHNNDDGVSELKYITEDGREAVFDGVDHNIMTDPAYKATYNYISPKPMESCENIGDYVEWGLKGLGHVIVDVVPYKAAGGQEEDDTNGGNERD